jgi:death on curing protein
LLESRAISHPFIDGNNRVAVAVTDVFLRINGHWIRASSGDIHAEFMRMFETGMFDLAHREPWLRARVVAAVAGG